MNKKILILSRRDDRSDYDTSINMSNGLKKYNKDSNVEYFGSFLEDIRFYFDGMALSATDTINKCDLKNYDGIFLTGWFKTRETEELALSVATYLSFYNKKILNSEIITNRSRGKLSQLVHASLNQVKITKFLAINDINQMSEFYKDTNFSFPLIVKSASASRGNDNYLVKNYQEMESVIRNLPTKIMLIQEFVPNDGDYRIIVMGDEAKLVIHRKSNDDGHLNNTSKGGVAKIINLADFPNEVKDESVKISKLLKREITGVDMIQHSQTGEYYMLEVNNMPQLSTGSFVDDKARVLSEFLSEWI